MARGDLTNDQWAKLAVVLPEVRMGRPPRDRRAVINAIRWRVRTGRRGATCLSGTGPGRPLMGCFGSGSVTVWAQVLTRLQAAAEAEQIITWDVSVDSTVCRAHQHAAGARKRGQIRNIRRVGWTPSPTTTPSAGHGAG